MEFKEFCFAVLNTWAEKVGIILTILPFIEKIPRVKEWLHDKPFIDRYVPLLYYIGAFFLVWGFYAAWKEQRHIALDAQRAIQELSVPEFSGRIGVRTAAPGGPSDNDTIVTIIGQIFNTGAPSAIKEMDFSAVVLDKRFEGIRIPVQVDVVLVGKNGQQVIFHPSEWLPKKCFEHPIERNGAAEGFYMAVLPGITPEQLFTAGTIVMLTFKDVSGASHQIDYTMNGKEGDLPELDYQHLQRAPIKRAPKR